MGIRSTFDDAVALVERYQRQPATAEERARDEAERRESGQVARLHTVRFLAAVGVALGIELAGGEGVLLLILPLGIYLVARAPFALWELRTFRRERDAWKARRAAERGGAG